MKAIRIFDKAMEWLCFALGAAILVDVLLQIVTRILPFNALSWTVEMGEMLLAALVWLAIAPGIADRSHINMDILVRRLTPKARTFFDILNSILFIVFLFFVAATTWGMMQNYLRFGTINVMLGINQFWTRLPMVVGCALGAVRLVIQIGIDIRDLVRKPWDDESPKCTDENAPVSEDSARR